MLKTKISPDSPRPGNPSQMFQMIEFLPAKAKVLSAKTGGSKQLDATGTSEPAFPPSAFECLIQEVIFIFVQNTDFSVFELFW